MDPEEERKPQTPEFSIGQDLGSISIAELERRIEVLNAEIERLKANIAEKQKSLHAANSIFKL